MGNDSPTFGRRLVQGLLGSFIIVLGLGSYLFVLKWRGPAGVLTTRTEWDRVFPFQPAWLYVYLAPYAIAPVLLGLLRRETFGWFLPAALLILAISLLIFAVLPTRTIEHPTSELGEGWTATIYRAMAAIDDPPANAAPSLHVSMTCLLAIALVRDFPRWWPITLGGVALVWLATLFTWQHHLLDVATGIILGILASLPFRTRGNTRRGPIHSS